ncbi:MAG: serine/threonine protein kinase, partial [Anaerolineaceae bacterium]|nr:serine/threonine protein kinase [Anaerolineaceae bacterium]
TESNTVSRLKEFRREARAMAQLKHTNIVHIETYGEYEGQPYFIMELLSSYTLKNRMAVPISAEEAVNLLLPIMDAVSYAHEKNILHRDLKPSNIIFRDDIPVLTDFGLAKIMESHREIDLSEDGFRKGTLQYMSPEQAMGLPVDGRSDEFALAVILYEMITGVRPYKSVSNSTDGVVINQIIRPDLTTLPKTIRPILSKALARDPENRYLTVKQFAAALRGFPENGTSSIDESDFIEETETLIEKPSSEQSKKSESEIINSVSSLGYDKDEQRKKSKKILTPLWFFVIFGLLIFGSFAFLAYYFYSQQSAQNDQIATKIPEQIPDLQLPLNVPVRNKLNGNEENQIYDLILPYDAKIQLSQWQIVDSSEKVNICLDFDNAETCLYELSDKDVKTQPFFLPAGEYQIILKTSGLKEIDYIMQWSVEPAIDIEKERNDNEEKSNPITLNKQYSGSLWTIDDVDYYEIVPEGSGRIEISFLAPEKEKGTAALFEAYLYGSESPYCMFVGNGEFQQNKWEVNTDKCYLKIQNVQTTGQSDSDSPFNSLVPYQFELNFVSDELE